MECEAELFWDCLNEVLRKEIHKEDYVFDPRGWVTGMAGSNMEGLKRSNGWHALERVKTCEFHLKECRNRQAHKLNKEDRSNFKHLCNFLSWKPKVLQDMKKQRKTWRISLQKAPKENIYKNGNPGHNAVARAVPASVSVNAVFVVDISAPHVKHIKNLLADDLGAWNPTGTKQQFYRAPSKKNPAREVTQEEFGNSNDVNVYQSTRSFFRNKSASDLQRIVIYLRGKKTQLLINV